MSEWISVEDRLPVSSIYVMVWNGEVRLGACHGKMFFGGSNYPIMNVTHWMPLPEPPKTGE